MFMPRKRSISSPRKSGKVGTGTKVQVRISSFESATKRSRDLPSSLIRYSRVPRPRERRSNKPKLHSLLRYVHADRAGEKSSFRRFIWPQPFTLGRGKYGQNFQFELVISVHSLSLRKPFLLIKS